MAVSQSQPTFTLLAATTLDNADLYKFVRVDTAGAATVVGTTNAINVVGTLLSEAPSVGTPVTVGALAGIGAVRLAASTEAAGGTIAASSAGLGVAPTSNALQLGTIVVGSSGTAGRIVQVAFGSPTHT